MVYVFQKYWTNWHSKFLTRVLCSILLFSQLFTVLFNKQLKVFFFFHPLRAPVLEWNDCLRYNFFCCQWSEYRTSSPKGNNRSPESNVPRSNLISKNSNSSKLWCLFLLHESIKRIQSKTTEKKWKHHFPHYKSMGVFLRCSRAANSVVGGPFWPKFELIHNIMHVLVTSKFEKDRININRDYVMTSIF